MIDVSVAEQIIQNHLGQFGSEIVTLEQSIGRILKENWKADRDLPPYDRVTMDGIAIRFSDFANGIRTFRNEGIAPAGMTQQTLSQTGSCLEVMTGSIMPLQADTVIKYEDLLMKNGEAIIQVDNIKAQQNVHFKGLDYKAGDLLVESDTNISPAEIGVGASIGKEKVEVAKQPKVMVISTGDELVPISKQPEAHQIRRSNVYRLLTTLKRFNIQADQDHLPDDKTRISQKLSNYLKSYDAIIMSGGVSKGKFDFLPEVLNDLGVEKLFHKIKQRPGKPFWFGQFDKKCAVFALPGNPVSSFLCMHRYFIPWLKSSLGTKPSLLPHAILEESVFFKPDLTYFLEVQINYNSEGQIIAIPKKGNGSGDLANLTLADAFIELPRGKNEYLKGESYPIHTYRF